MTRGRTDDVWVGGGEDVDVDDGPGKVGMNASECACESDGPGERDLGR